MKMLLMLLRSLFSRPKTVRFPARPGVSNHYRGLVHFDQTRCSGCGMCSFRCTSRAIMFRNSRTDYKWSYDPGQCTYCGACVDGCDSNALSMDPACPPIYTATGELRSAYTIQRKPPAPTPQTQQPAAGGAQ